MVSEIAVLIMLVRIERVGGRTTAGGVGSAYGVSRYLAKKTLASLEYEGFVIGRFIDCGSLKRKEVYASTLLGQAVVKAIDQFVAMAALKEEVPF